MFKIIVALMVAGSMLIAVGTIWLVVLNWSQKLYGPLVSIALGGLVTVLITVVALLKEERIQGGNRFAQSGSERFLWQHSRLRLPQATRLTLEYVPSSPETGPERHTVRLVKSGFFEVNFEVTPIIATGTGVLPAGLVLPADQRSHIRTFQYEVRMSADFYRLTAGNWQTEELKNWAKWLFSEVKRSLGDG